MKPQTAKILIIEDNSAVRELMAVLLRRSDYQVFEAVDRLQGLEPTLGLCKNLHHKHQCEQRRKQNDKG